MDTATFKFREFFWTCLSKALHSSYGIAGAISLGLTLVGGAVQDRLPWTKAGWDYLAWVAPLILGLTLFVPALLRGAYELYQQTALERDSLGERVAVIESRFSLKERLASFVYHMDHVIRRFERWNPDSGLENPVDSTGKLLERVEQYLTEHVGLHYAVRMHPFSARQRTESDLQNSYENLRRAEAELKTIISELAD